MRVSSTTTITATANSCRPTRQRISFCDRSPAPGRARLRKPNSSVAATAMHGDRHEGAGEGRHGGSDRVRLYRLSRRRGQFAAVGRPRLSRASTAARNSRALPPAGSGRRGGGATLRAPGARARRRRRRRAARPRARRRDCRTRARAGRVPVRRRPAVGRSPGSRGRRPDRAPWACCCRPCAPWRSASSARPCASTARPLPVRP